MTLMIAARFVFVAFLVPVAPEDGANIGAGLMLFSLLGSLALLGAALAPPQAPASSGRDDCARS